MTQISINNKRSSHWMRYNSLQRRLPKTRNKIITHPALEIFEKKKKKNEPNNINKTQNSDREQIESISRLLTTKHKMVSLNIDKITKEAGEKKEQETSPPN